jgi:hypothetical protein
MNKNHAAIIQKDHLPCAPSPPLIGLLKTARPPRHRHRHPHLLTMGQARIPDVRKLPGPALMHRAGGCGMR